MWYTEATTVANQSKLVMKDYELGYEEACLDDLEDAMCERVAENEESDLEPDPETEAETEEEDEDEDDDR